MDNNDKYIYNMDYGNVNSGITSYWKELLAEDEKKADDAKHKRNAALITDFASSLVSLYGQKNGARYLPSQNTLEGANKLYDSAKEKLRRAHIDYKGKMAQLLLNDKERSIPLSGIIKNRETKLPLSVSRNVDVTHKADSSDLMGGSILRQFSEKKTGDNINVPWWVKIKGRSVPWWLKNE